MPVEYTGLPFKALNRAVNERPCGDHACVVHEVSRGEIIRTIDHDITIKHTLQRINARESLRPRNNMDMRIERAQSSGRDSNLELAYIVTCKENLPLQVRYVHTVCIKNIYSPHACCSQIQQCRATQSTRADHEHTSAF